MLFFSFRFFLSFLPVAFSHFSSHSRCVFSFPSIAFYCTFSTIFSLPIVLSSSLYLSSIYHLLCYSSHIPHFLFLSRFFSLRFVLFSFIASSRCVLTHSLTIFSLTNFFFYRYVLSLPSRS